MLHSKRKLSLPISFERWLREAAGPDVVRLAPLDVDVTIAVDTLPPSFHGDPADRIIVATARALRLPLATHDRTIRRSRVARIWKP